MQLIRSESLFQPEYNPLRSHHVKRELAHRHGVRIGFAIAKEGMSRCNGRR